MRHRDGQLVIRVVIYSEQGANVEGVLGEERIEALEAALQAAAEEWLKDTTGGEREVLLYTAVGVA